MQRYFLSSVSKNSIHEEFICRFFEMGDRKINLLSSTEIKRYQKSGDSRVNDVFILAYESSVHFAKTLEGFNNGSRETLCKVVVMINLAELEDRDLQDFSSNLLLNERIIGVIDTSSAPELSVPLLRSIFSESASSDLLSNYKTVLKKLSGELGSVVGSSLGDLQRVRKMHEYVVPLRKESIKGITVCGKYAVGEASGGEFFDIVYNDSKLVLILTSADSYLASSTLLSLFSEFKDRGSLSVQAVKKFITNISDHFPSSSNGKIELTILDIDLVTHETNMFQFGNSALFSNFGELKMGNELVVHPSFMESAHCSFKLEGGNKLLVVSPGLNSCSNSFVGKEKLMSYIQKRVGDMSSSFLNEIFFQLKKDDESDFLIKDASAIFIKVDLNVITN